MKLAGMLELDLIDSLGIKPLHKVQSMASLFSQTANTTTTKKVSQLINLVLRLKTKEKYLLVPLAIINTSFKAMRPLHNSKKML